MKKKVKKIPKFNSGGTAYDMLMKTPMPVTSPTFNPATTNSQSGATAGTIAAGKEWKDFNKTQKANAVSDAIGGSAALWDMASSGQDVSVGTAVKGMATGAQAGAAFGPIGMAVGAGLGLWAGTAGRGNKVDVNSASELTSDIAKKGSGWLKPFGMSDEAMYRRANMVANANIAARQSENLKVNYHNNPNVPGSINVLAAEGGIMRRPVDALVSKGELIYNPITKKLNKVPGSKGKPNKEDDVYAKLSEGDVVISNSPTMLMANGKTPAQNLEGLVDSDRNVKAKEAIIKKVVNWQEANKTKPQEYAKFDGGGIAGINKYGYNKNMSDFVYWDKDKNEYKKEYLDWVNNLTEQDVRDIEAGKYGDMTEYFSKNKGKKLDVATAQKLMTDKKYGNWHKIGQAVVGNKAKNNTPLVEKALTRNIIGTNDGMWQTTHPYDAPIKYNVMPMDKPTLKKLANPSEADGIIAAYKAQNKGKGTFNWLNTLSDYAPLAAALLGDYDYHKEEAITGPAKYIPTGVSINPIRRAADESYTMARYNQANISPNTGAGMAYGLQAASNRAKTLADAYTWQQDAQNKLIAQNVGIYNDWSKRYDAARYQAIADTRANEAAAQQMRDSAIRDAYEFTTGRRNDRWKLSMLEPMFKYAVDDNIWKNFKIA